MVTETTSLPPRRRCKSGPYTLSDVSGPVLRVCTERAPTHSRPPLNDYWWKDSKRLLNVTGKFTYGRGHTIKTILARIIPPGRGVSGATFGVWSGCCGYRGPPEKEMRKNGLPRPTKNLKEKNTIILVLF